jgi:molybdopterin-binding protein
MKISARNVIRGRVVAIHEGAINSEVLIDIGGGTQLVSVITKTSVKALGLEPGKDALAIIKASNILVATE